MISAVYGENLKRARAQKGFSRPELARRAHVSDRTITRHEQAEKPPLGEHDPIANRLAAALGVPLGELIEGQPVTRATTDLSTVSLPIRQIGKGEQEAGQMPETLMVAGFIRHQDHEYEAHVVTDPGLGVALNTVLVLDRTMVPWPGASALFASQDRPAVMGWGPHLEAAGFTLIGVIAGRYMPEPGYPPPAVR